MSSVGDLGAEIRRVLELVRDARRHAVYAGNTLQEAWQLLAMATDGSSHDQIQEALAHCRTAGETVGEAIGCLALVDEQASAYGDRLGVSGSPSSAVVPPMAPVSRSQPAALGTWQGKTATDHVRDEGQAIGRAPARPKQNPIREVRSVADLDELFVFLSRGGQVVDKPSYEGQFIRFPDGTTIGYRVKSRTTVEPTIDMTSPDGGSLKIHVNTQGWDRHG